MTAFVSLQNFVGHVQACCLDFLYFNRHLFEAGLSHLTSHPEEARMLSLLLPAFSDGHHLLSHTCLDAEAVHQVYSTSATRRAYACSDQKP